ncbi:Serine-rich adhesin for platelets [Planktothrix tepida]|uniref:FG-GAP-like repeat-containing protein n=1 Tax=Planktothrix tepida TaxID=1678309 RepID=UPI0020B431C1|nr:FG-GAP-like repeat-containing protein [Planktothrix tepida]CAD5975712.1 Serine-rich adhesin for platelets [Planktothrix tepida]
MSNTSDGTWQFSNDNGSNWTPFGAVTDSSATLLSNTTLVRFVPNANFNGNVSLTYRGWDGTSGSNGQTGVNVSTNGGITAFSTATATSNLSITNINDTPTGTVNITGTATQNQILTATNTLADVDGLGTLNYQWQESADNGVTWTNISGATNNTFALSQTQVGKTVQVKVSYTDLLGTAETVNSSPTAVVTNVNDLPTGNVSITGTATQNQILTATNTLADADGLGTLNYQWQESSDNGVTWSDISGATNDTFTLSQTQVGKTVQVKVSYTDLLGTAETVNSSPTSVVSGLLNNAPTGNVSITGTATQNQILTATNTLADVDGLGTFNYQWQESSDNGVTWTNISGATNNTFTLSQAQVGKKVQVKVSYTDLLGTAETVNSSPTSVITNINDLPTGNVNITGTATQNQILTATNTLADADGLGTFNYQWQESADNGVTWTNINGATNNTFALSQTQVGKTVQVKVSYTDLLGTAEIVNSSPTAVVSGLLNNAPTGTVNITGTATQNQILTATNTLADVDGLGTLNYQWQESADNGVTWTNISGATNNTFTLSQAQVGKKVQVKVSYTDLLGTAEIVNSSPTSVVSGLLNNAPTGTVNIAGTATQNQILTATNTLADVDGLGTLNYQWQESGDNGVTWTNINGATNNTFTLSQTQVGKKVQVKVSYTDLLGTAETVNSSPTSVVSGLLNNAPTGTVNIAGTATQNQILTATNTLADVDGLGTFNYQWQESADNGVTWTNISGATNNTFALSQTQVGKKVQVKVSYTDLLGTAETVNSSPTTTVTNVNDLPTGNVSITGTATQNQILTATNTLADVDGLGTFNYQWQESSDNGVTWTNISGATNNTFTLSQTQVGKKVQVKVSYTDLLGTAETVNSSPTSVVSGLLNNAPTGTVNITGTATQNQILTATNTLADVDGLGTFNYQWQESSDNGVTWTDISGATNNTFTLSQTQVGKKVQVKVSYTDLLGTAETVNSSPTSVVTNINDLPTGNVSITGTAKQNQTLTATNTLADADGLGTFNYQWQQSADNGVTWTNINGATNNTFTLSQTQVGKKVQVKVSYTDLLGTAETVNSSPTTTVTNVNDLPTGNVSITGTAKQNQTLTATNTLADVDGLGTFNYQWQESADNGVTWTNISGATNNTFTLSQTQVGKTVQVKVSYTDLLGTAETVNSSPTTTVTNINDLPTGNVSITGTAKQNQTLTATNTLADVDGLGTLNYQWQQSSDNGVTWTNINGATNNTFALSQTQVGKKVQVKVSYTDQLGTQETVNSTPTATVTNVTAVNHAPVLDNTNITYSLTPINEDDSNSSGDTVGNIIQGLSIKENTNVSLTGVVNSSVTTADFDKDGDTDILLTGDAGSGSISKIYSNNGSGGFSLNTNVSLTGVYDSSVTTADFDSDGNTDILLTGSDSPWNLISKIYSNNGSGGFSLNTNISLPGVRYSSVTTADFDKDGDTDILLTGRDSSGSISQIYSNNGSGGFSLNTNISLPGVRYSSVTTADFDKDGDTDILLTGVDSSKKPISQIYSNNGSGGFSLNTNVSLTGVYRSSVTTADFDKDGDTDILLTGRDSSGSISKIYSNNGSGGFSLNTNVSLPGVRYSSVTTADFDKDGDTDILLTGVDSSGRISKIYSNNGSGGFSENTNVSLTGVAFSSVTTADFDSDGNTDILLTGWDSSSKLISKIYNNLLPISDVDTTTITEAIAITAADKNGTWQYSTDNGTTWTNFPAVSNSKALLLDASNKVRFQPNADYNGTITTALTFRAWDQSTGTAGTTADTRINGRTTAFSTNTATASIVVTAFNNAPTATDKTLTVNEDNNYTFTTADFGFSDLDTEDILASIKITQLPTVGTLQLNGTAVTANQVITAADIPSLVFTPVANANGSSYANFKFTVNDGIIDSVAANTITIDVTAVNDIPVLNTAITAQTANPDSNFNLNIVVRFV